MSDIHEFLDQLDAARIHHTVARVRSGYLMVQVAVPGERWEIEFGSDGGVETEVFRNDGKIEGPEALDRLLREFSDRGSSNQASERLPSPRSG